MKYYAIWQGKESEWAVLVNTTRSKKKAAQYVNDMAKHGIAMYYTVEQGPIVPPGQPAVKDVR
jgi:hypothetical protein